MTVLLALVGTPARQGEAQLGAALRRRLTGGDATIALSRVSPDVVLAVAAPAWDEDASRRVATNGRYTVIAHAAIMYRQTLNAALDQARHPPCPRDASSAEAILAAVEAWRWDCVQHLEGEFSFVVWDASERCLFAARDHAGGRTLFHAGVADGLVVSSSLRLAAATPGVAPGWNLLALAEDSADIDLAVATETAYQSVQRLPGGHALTCRQGGEPTVSRWWEIPLFERDSGIPFDEAAKTLRDLIADAVEQRSDLSRGTAVMLSGGYDSTAIYAAGNWRMPAGGGPTPLRSVSLSHPPGNPGREDELILATTRHWGASPRFIPEADIPAHEPSLARAAHRDEPFYHTYELWNRELARGCRTQGSLVALNGNGGDAWFSTSPIFFADLLRQGRWLQLRREWTTMWGALSWYRLFKVAIQPNIPHGMLDSLALLRGGRPIADPAAREIPRWLNHRLVTSPDFLARRQRRQERRRGESHSSAERTWFLRTAFTERVNALVFAICQGEGVELRTPLLDTRIVRFAATRPRWESNSGRANKHLLRESMRGLLPDEVIAPRATRTGLPVSYLDRTLDGNLQESRGAFRDGMLLAQIGVVDHQRLLREIDSFLNGLMNDRERAAAMVAAVQAEWWLRSIE